MWEGAGGWGRELDVRAGKSVASVFLTRQIARDAKPPNFSRTAFAKLGRKSRGCVFKRRGFFLSQGFIWLRGQYRGCETQSPTAFNFSASHYRYAIIEEAVHSLYSAEVNSTVLTTV